MSRRRTREIIAELDTEIFQQEANLRQLKLARDAIASTIPTPKTQVPEIAPREVRVALTDPEHPDVKDLIRWLTLEMPQNSTPEQVCLVLRDIGYPGGVRGEGIPYGPITNKYYNALVRFRHLNSASRLAKVKATLKGMTRPNSSLTQWDPKAPPTRT